LFRLNDDQALVAGMTARMCDVGRYTYLTSRMGLEAAKLASSVTDQTNLELINNIKRVVSTSATILKGSFAELNNLTMSIVKYYDPKLNWKFLGESGYSWQQTRLLVDQVRVGGRLISEDEACYADVREMRKNLLFLENDIRVLAEKRGVQFEVVYPDELRIGPTTPKYKVGFLREISLMKAARLTIENAVEAIKREDEKDLITKPKPKPEPKLEPKSDNLDGVKWGLITVVIIFAFVGGVVRFGLGLV